MQDNKHSDREIFEQLRNPSTQEVGFRRLVQKYKYRAYGLAIKMVFDHHDADDITQEAFIKIWKKKQQLKEADKLKSWVFKIVSNEALQTLRQRKRKSFLFPGASSGKEQEKQAIAAHPYFSGDEIQKRFYEAMTALSGQQRNVFTMKYFEEMKYQEISEVTGLAVGTLKATYHQSVKKIRRELENV